MTIAKLLFINGHWTAPSSGKTLAVISPIDDTVVGEIPAGDAADVEAAVQAAAVAYKGPWGKTTGKDRAVVLKAIADQVKCCPLCISLVLRLLAHSQIEWHSAQKKKDGTCQARDAGHGQAYPRSRVGPGARQQDNPLLVLPIILMGSWQSQGLVITG